MALIFHPTLLILVSLVGLLLSCCASTEIVVDVIHSHIFPLKQTFSKEIPISHLESLNAHALVKGNEGAGYEAEEILVKHFRWSLTRSHTKEGQQN